MLCVPLCTEAHAVCGTAVCSTAISETANVSKMGRVMPLVLLL